MTELLKSSSPYAIFLVAIVVLVKESYIAIRRSNGVTLEDIDRKLGRTEAKTFEMEQRQREGCLAMMKSQNDVAERQTEILQKICTHLEVIRNGRVGAM